MKYNNAYNLFYFGMVSFVFSLSAIAADNMRFHGALVAEPCVISPGDETISLKFDALLNNDLYRYTRTTGVAFVLHLIDCDTRLAKTVVMTINGTEDSKLPGMLQLDSGSQAKGIGVGIETIDGIPWKINEPGSDYPIKEGNTQVEISAFVQGETDAIANRNITPGNFNATATFTLQYQ